MRVTIKTLQQTQFPLEILPEETVLQVKEKISLLAEAKTVAVERQKLIHAGKVLENDVLISQTPIKEGEFVILMTVTPKPISTSTSTSTSTATSKPVASQVKVEGEERVKKEQFPREAESQLVTGEAYDEAVNRLVDMGFAKEEVVAAMRASFNNPERAVEYLTLGIIPSMEGGDFEGSAGSASAVPTAAVASSGAFDFLRNDPQFQQLRSLIQQNPAMLGPIIEQLSHSSPELLHLIEQNREEFYALIMEGTSPEDLAVAMGEDDDSEGDVEGTEEAESDFPAGSQILHVSEEERVAIERLEAMGFDKSRVVEAFFACDKNEELAANYLLEHLEDD